MKTQKLKLYVWHGVLVDYTSGVAFAMARSPEEAVELVRASGLEDSHFKGVLIDGVEPKVYETPAGSHVWGGG